MQVLKRRKLYWNTASRNFLTEVKPEAPIGRQHETSAKTQPLWAYLTSDFTLDKAGSLHKALATKIVARAFFIGRT